MELSQYNIRRMEFASWSRTTLRRLKMGQLLANMIRVPSSWLRLNIVMFSILAFVGGSWASNAALSNIILVHSA